LNLPLGIFLFGVAFFGLLIVVNVVRARRKREKLYYLGAAVSFTMLVAIVLVFLNQFVLGLTLVGVTAILSIAGLPKMQQELTKQWEGIDLSAPLRGRDFLTNKGWLKLASRWGQWKTIFLYYLLCLGIGGAIFFTLTTLGRMYGYEPTFYRLTYATTAMTSMGTFPIVTTHIFYRQFKQAFQRVVEGGKDENL
jgi:hypothetical protein